MCLTPAKTNKKHQREMNYDEWKLASPPESTEVTDCCRSSEYYEEYSEEEDCDVTICDECKEPCRVVEWYD